MFQDNLQSRQNAGVNENVGPPNVPEPEANENTGVAETHADIAGVPNYQDETNSAEIADPVETKEDQVERLNNQIDAIEHELSDQGNSTDDNEEDNDILASMSGYQESKQRIAQLERDMDQRYGTRIRQNLRSRRTRNETPAKFKGMEAENIEEQLNVMHHKKLSLKDYANIYAAIHHSGIEENKNYQKSDIVSTILTQ